MIRRVLTENGWVRGLPAADPRITSYKGIPFAAPPVGVNRWRAPQPCSSWDGDYLAYDFAPISYQPVTGYDKNNIYTREWAVDVELPMGEDCLYLNIWAPADGRRNMPVYVWYFGGGLQVGHTAEMEFDGERIARRGIVVVTVNYRLNAFGFLCHPEITAEAPDAPANFGFLDQQAGTQWVKRNIEAFGGDPNCITIGGQSAGGMSVGAQIACKDNEGLFHRAIIQSGIFASCYPKQLGLVTDLQQAEARGVRFFEYLGVKSLAEARAIDGETLYRKTLAWDESVPWNAAIDGKFCKASPSDWYLEKEKVVCPVMLGSTDSEFMLAPEATDDESLRAYTRRLPGVDAERFLAQFRHPATAASIWEDGHLSAIDYGIYLAARANPEMPIYQYQFQAEIPGWDHPGTFHSVDLWFFFETLAKCWRPFVGKHYDLARQMCDYWCNFIKTGDPNGKDDAGMNLPYWPKLSLDQPVRMAFAETSRPERCEPSELMKLLAGE